MMTSDEETAPSRSHRVSMSRPSSEANFIMNSWLKRWQIARGCESLNISWDTDLDSGLIATPSFSSVGNPSWGWGCSAMLRVCRPSSRLEAPPADRRHSTVTALPADASGDHRCFGALLHLAPEAVQKDVSWRSTSMSSQYVTYCNGYCPPLACHSRKKSYYVVVSFPTSRAQWQTKEHLSSRLVNSGPVVGCCWFFFHESLCFVWWEDNLFRIVLV